VPSESFSTSQEAQPVQIKTFETPLFGELPQVTLTDPGHDEYIRTHPDAVAPPLPNTDVVGDHFHFSQEVVKGFIAVWSHVRKSLSDYLYQTEMAKFSDEKSFGIDKEGAEVHVRAKVAEVLEETKKKLYGYRFALRRGTEKRAKETEEEKRTINGLLDDLPLLKAAWEVKNAGPEIFPHKPRASRSKAARRAANAQKASAAVPPVDMNEVARKLDEWAEMSDELKPYFTKALSLVSAWRPELLRIASTGLNNAKAEAKVSQLRTFNRMGRGLRFDMLRARQLWFDAFRRTNRWPSFCDDSKATLPRADSSSSSTPCWRRAKTRRCRAETRPRRRHRLKRTRVRLPQTRPDRKPIRTKVRAPRWPPKQALIWTRSLTMSRASGTGTGRAARHNCGFLMGAFPRP
jgi:hypothetical protein